MADQTSNLRESLLDQGADWIDLFQQLPGFVMVTSGPDHFIEFANAQLAQLVRYREVVGKKVREALPELASQGFLDIRDKVYRSGVPFRGRAVPFALQRTPEGELEPGYIDFVYQPIKRKDGSVCGIIFAGYDITEHKAAEDRVRLLQSELIHVSRSSAMGTMAMTLAHQLNQPLATVANYAAGAEKLLGQMNADGAEALVNALQEIRAAAGRAGEIVRQARDMLRKEKPTLARANLGETVREAVSLGLVDAGESGISTQFDLAPGILVKVEPIQLQQVILNLLRNAVEAMAGCERCELTITSRTCGSVAELCIADTGPGLSGEVENWAFEPFVTSKPQGLGVGLSICRTIVEAHGGKIWAQNNPDGGATFCLTMPLA